MEFPSHFAAGAILETKTLRFLEIKYKAVSTMIRKVDSPLAKGMNSIGRSRILANLLLLEGDTRSQKNDGGYVREVRHWYFLRCTYTLRRKATFSVLKKNFFLIHSIELTRNRIETTLFVSFFLRKHEKHKQVRTNE